MKQFANTASRNGAAGTILVATVAAVGLLGALVWYYANNSEVKASIDPITVNVEKGDFVSKVLDQGEVQSSENIEIRCEVRARNGQLTVISLVPEGTLVKEGDFLVRLDSTAFEKERETQRIAVANAKAAVIQADATLQTAEKSKDEYLTGTFKALELEINNQIIDAEGLIETSRSELAQAKAVLDHSRALHSKGFITQRQLDADEFAVKRSTLAVTRNENLEKLSMNQLKVLRELTLAKEKVQLESNIESARVKLESERDALRVQENQMKEILEMIERCEVVVPEGISGQVVYARESRGRGEEWVLEEGANVRESQVLIRLPNADKMEVKTLINEQNITQIDVGMPASIKVDALSDKTLKGLVTKVNQYAESSGWGSSSVRKYAVKVRIFDPPTALKPGMNASVSIQSKYVPGATMVPIQTVYGVQDRQFCLVKNGESFDTREVQVGGNNTQMALIKEGLSEGEELVMNPGAYKDMMELPEVNLDPKIEMPADQKADAEKMAMAAKKNKATAAAGSGGGPGAGGGRPGGQKGGGQRGGGGGGMPSADSIADRVMQRSDTNGDGKLDAAEVANLDDRSKSWAGTADTDGDGDISKAEVVKAMKEVMKKWGGGGGGGRR